MAPTVQTNQRDDSRRKTGEKKAELVCRVKYNNKALDIPFDPKFLIYSIDKNNFVQYKPTSLERTFKNELLTEPDMGMNIDLVNPDAYIPTEGGHLDIEDEQLLEDEFATPKDAKRSQRHNRNVSWLRKTEYISTEYNRFIPKGGQEARVGGINVKKYLNEEDLYKDKVEQIKAIEKTFEAAQQPIAEHYSKKGVHPVSILPVYPDFEMWKYPCAQVIFDTDPSVKQPGVVNNNIENGDMSHAMIRGMVDAETNEHFVAYFLPTEETCLKRKRDLENSIEFEDDGEYEYALIREYNWSVKNKSSKGYEETYFMVLRDDGVYYNELETRVRLSKRRKIGSNVPQMCKSRLIVKHRNPNETELRAQEIRLQMLEPPGEEEEEGDDDNADMEADELAPTSPGTSPKSNDERSSSGGSSSSSSLGSSSEDEDGKKSNDEKDDEEKQ